MKTLNILLVMFCGVLVFGGVSGCASHREKTVTTTVVDDGTRSRMDGDYARSETTTTTETVEHSDSDRGILHIVGDIIALPFRAVGALLDAIF